MLNENDDAAPLAAETAAAMRDLARTVTDAPPLRLTADATGLASARPRRRARGPRFRWSRGGPLLAAAAVVALAVTLVTVKDLPNGSVAAHATPAATPEGGLPEYYVALNPASGSPGAPNGLIVGDTVTGKTVAVVAPPAHASFEAVSAAADDRTFVVSTMPTVSEGPVNKTSFYLLTIAPGSAPAARLTRLPIAPLAGVLATALSASGKELAVASLNVNGEAAVRELAVYSVATGRPVRSWSTTDSVAIVSSVGTGELMRQYTAQWPALTWFNGDRALAFPVLTRSGPPTTGRYWLEVRSVTMTAAAGDLMTESTVMANLGAEPGSAGPCGTFFPGLSGNGTTLFCLASRGPVGHVNPTTVSWLLQWRSVPTSLANEAAWDFLPYNKVIGVPTGSTVYPAMVWSSSTGATLLVEWTVVMSSYDDTGAHGTSARLGEMTFSRHGWTFTALPAPAIFTAGGGAPSIAW